MTDFSKTKSMFHLPDGVIYLDGNSLGPLPKAAVSRLNETITDEWGEMLITGWNRAGWMAMPRRVGDRLARLIGAPEGSVSMGDTLSIKVYQALASALELNPDRKLILSDTGNFPTDLYMAQGLLKTMDAGHELVTVEPEAIQAEINDQIAVVMLTEVDYRTGRKHDMAKITRFAHEKGALVIWDLAHSAGALEVDVTGCKADFAVGCTYKYLNSGPGGPAFIYVAPHLQQRVRPALSGWLGHQSPFAFEADYKPGEGIERMRVGTPAILQFAALDAALDVWDDVDLADVRKQSIAMSERFTELVCSACPDLDLASPHEPENRGSQVSFRFEEGYAVVQALIERGVIGDFRVPNIMRFGFTPLYLDMADIEKAARILIEVLQKRLWDKAKYKVKSEVT